MRVSACGVNVALVECLSVYLSITMKQGDCCFLLKLHLVGFISDNKRCQRRKQNYAPLSHYFTCRQATAHIPTWTSSWQQVFQHTVVENLKKRKMKSFVETVMENDILCEKNLTEYSYCPCALKKNVLKITVPLKTNRFIFMPRIYHQNRLSSKTSNISP